MVKRTAGVGSLLIALALGCAFGAEAPSANLSDTELAELRALLDDAQDQLMARLTGMTDEQWSFKQSPDRWSVGECVEHIVRSPRAILDGIVYTLGLPPNPNWAEQTRGKLELVRQTVLTRNPGGAGSPFKAPYEVSPTEKWDRARGIRELYSILGELRAFVETMPPGIKSRTFMNPFPQIGLLNAHDWLTLSALHVMRHTQQIIEVQEDPNYPAKPAVGAGAR